MSVWLQSKELLPRVPVANLPWVQLNWQTQVDWSQSCVSEKLTVQNPTSSINFYKNLPHPLNRMYYAGTCYSRAFISDSTVDYSGLCVPYFHTDRMNTTLKTITFVYWWIACFSSVEKKEFKIDYIKALPPKIKQNSEIRDSLMIVWFCEIKRNETILRVPLRKEITVCMNPSIGKSSENSRIVSC